MELILSIVILAFLFEFMDAYAGQGYGLLTPLLIVLGYEPLTIVFGVLATSGIISLTAGIYHHYYENVDYSSKRSKKILGTLITLGIIAVIAGAGLATHIPATALKIYIGALTVIIGIEVIKTRKRKYSHKQVFLFGALAAFNKGTTGGGFGPILAGGQIISGVKARAAVGITSLVEGIVSIIGLIAFLLMNSGVWNTDIIASLLTGGLIASPLAAYTLSKTKPHYTRRIVGTLSIIMGLVLLGNVLLF